MLNELLALIRRYEMVSPGDRIVCAVSGGADSMALLWAMVLLSDKLGITVSAAHFNHRLRGTESDRDETFVRDFCAFHDIPLHVGAGNVVAGSKGLEAAARDARYAFLRSLPGKIATAHTADDNAETVLMHLVRGTGLKGLGAIAPVTDRLIRPMLGVTRQQVEAFLEENHIPHIEDSSNAGDAFLRNRLRHSVMPLLVSENPRLAENLSAMAMRLREDSAALEAAARQEGMPSVSRLRTLPGAVRNRILEQFLKDSGVREPEAEHMALAENLVFSEKPSARASFPNGVVICRCYDRLEACTGDETLMPRIAACPGVTELPEIGLRIICTNSDAPRLETDAFTVCPVGQIRIRCREAGDTMRLSGGTKSLKKLFSDRKIPARQRLLIPVLADDAGVLGVYGIGANLDRTQGALPMVEVRFERISPVTDRDK